jgi:hypothetical protein
MAAERRPDPMEVEAGALFLTEVPRAQYLNRELLSWATNALQAVMVTPECRSNNRALHSLRDALLQLDELYTPIFHREALDHG